MRVPHYLTRGRHGYFFRITVPAHLRPVLHRVSYSRALRHRLADAATLARELASRYAWVFAALEAGAMANDEDALKAGLSFLYGQDGDRTRFRLKNGPHGPELETNGSPEDNAAGAAAHGRALAAWERVEKAKV